MPSPVPYRKVEKLLKDKGYVYTHTSGSHFIWKNAATGSTLSIPVHKGLVKFAYVRQIEKLK